MSRSLLVSWQRSIPSHYETSINPLSSQKEISCHQNNKPGRFITCQCIIYAIVLRCMNSDCHFIIDPFFLTILTIWKTSIQSLYLTEIYITYRLLSYLFVSRILDTKNPRSLSSRIIWKATSLIIDKEQLCHFLASVLCHCQGTHSNNNRWESYLPSSKDFPFDVIRSYHRWGFGKICVYHIGQ